jgi:hypothetical protein
MRLFSVFVLLVFSSSILMVSCKNSKKSAEKAEAEKVENQGNISQEEMSENVELKAMAEPDRIQKQETIEVDRLAPIFPDSLYFRMDRTPCFGQCPVYTVNVFRSGWALLEGRQFFDYEGTYTTKFNEEELDRIQKMAKDIGYAKLRHVYDAPVTDLPSSATIVNSQDVQHWVYNRMNAPDELRNFESEMESMIKDKQWTVYTKVNPNRAE